MTEAANSEVQNAAPENADEPRWEATVTLKGQDVSVPLSASLIEQEVKDQISIKGSHRKAILRATNKKVVAVLKGDWRKLSGKALEDFQWNAFILFINGIIDGRHLALRDDPAQLEALLKDPRLQPPA